MVERRRSFNDDADAWQVLRKLELVKSEQEITRAAILLFGKTPQSPLTQSVVHAGRLRGHSNIMDNRIIEGRVITQIEETVQFVEKNLHVRFEITGEPQRKEVWDYPLPALREAITNAVCHRDYGDVADIQIKIFEDSLQVWSPGGLSCGMTIETLLDPGHSSKPRNKLIAQVFYDLGLIERYGSGIHRILDECRNAGLPEPQFENFSGGFRIKFCLIEARVGRTPKSVVASGGGENVIEKVHRKSSQKSSQKRSQKIFETMSKDPHVTIAQLSVLCEIGTRAVQKNIDLLREQGLLRRVGADKGGRWDVGSETWGVRRGK